MKNMVNKMTALNDFDLICLLCCLDILLHIDFN